MNQAAMELIAHEFGEIKAVSLDHLAEEETRQDNAHEIARGWGFEEELKKLDAAREELKRD